MKLGVIGAGMIVREFLPELKKLSGVEVVALQGTQRSRERAEKLCAENKVAQVVYDFDALCEAGIDTVYVAVPNALHFSCCREALLRGKNVIVEKPIASNEREAALLERLAKEKGLFLFEAITTLYLPAFGKVREWLEKIGTLKIVQCQFNQYSSRYDAFLKGETAPVFDPERSGGALMDINLYNLHFVMGLFGEPAGVHYEANVDRGVDTSGILTLHYPDFQAVCVAAKDSAGESGVMLQGTKGYIKTELPLNVVGKATLRLRDGTEEEFDDGMAKTRMIPEFEAFVKAINRNDLAFCYQMLEKSVAVSRVQTRARLQAGVIFPADREA